MLSRNSHLGLRPLTARSVVLSVLLGTHPPRLPARQLVRAGALLGIQEGTIRVALSRMVSDGELEQDGGGYRLTGRLLERQARQDESRTLRIRSWDGTWEVALVTTDRRQPAERGAFRAQMGALRLAELREGVWLRPANLDRALPDLVVSQCLVLSARPEYDPAALAASLWDLDAWAEQARALLGAMRGRTDLAEAFVVAAAAVHHMLADPLLPSELLPSDWPGDRLREEYQRFETKHREILDEHLRGGPLPVAPLSHAASV